MPDPPANDVATGKAATRSYAFTILLL